MRKYILVFLILFYSCGSSLSNEQKQFENLLTKYIDDNPIIVLGNSTSKNEKIIKKRMFAHPSYQVFFNKNENKDVLILKLAAHYNDLNINIKNNNIDSLIFNNQKAKGWYLFDGNPVIVFDSEKISRKYISTSLNSKIPDSLKLQEIGNHIDSYTKTYILDNRHSTLDRY